MTLPDVLSPVTLAYFLSNYVGQRHLVVRGPRGKFDSFISWHSLNEALSSLRATADRIMLVKHGRGIPRESYVYTSPNNSVQYLIGPALGRHISAGATLVVNEVDVLFPRLRRLVESCEDVFHIHVTANLYAGWRTDNGFDVHWDKHDTVVVQIKGCKNWKVWSPTRLCPLPDERVEPSRAPSESPVWEGVLQDGDVLYMPRGWWHVAYPRDEPSLHVTLGLRHHTGLEFLTWIVNQLSDSTDVRRDIPHWKSADERSAWIQSLRASVCSALSDDSIDRCIYKLAERVHPRPIISLPDVVAPAQFEVPRLDATTVLRLSHPPTLRFQAINETDNLTFTRGGAEWRCHGSLGPALALLHPTTPCTLSDMQKVLVETAKPLLRPFIAALIKAEVVWAQAHLHST